MSPVEKYCIEKTHKKIAIYTKIIHEFVAVAFKIDPKKVSFRWRIFEFEGL